MNKTEKSEIALAEERVLSFWRTQEIFKKSLQKNSPGGDKVFYDGPPFATGLPHYGHILVSTIKDAVPRYWTMRGFHVERRWGWDCHGLPIENIVEKDLKVSGRREIESFGVQKFNEYARSKVLDFVDHWRGTVERIGRWVDFDGSYKTMDNSFIESVWWALKELWDKKLIYEGTKVLPYCPRCETPISNSEIAMDNSYKDISDLSVYVKLELVDEPKTFLIAWTTTPWTLPGNTGAAVNPEVEYVKISGQNEKTNEQYIVAKEKLGVLEKLVGMTAPKIVSEFKGRELVGKKYKPLFDFFDPQKSSAKNFSNKENIFKVWSADYVTTESGTGIVHLAPGYGEEDMALANKNKIPFVLHVGHDGRFVADLAKPLRVSEEEEIVLAGLPAKPKPTKEDPHAHQSSDVLIVRYLARAGLLFAKEKVVHSYPHCHRCETPLYYFALRAWFVDVQKHKKHTLALNEKINWVPSHLKHGRFKNGIEGAPDWNISRNRYWASPLPFWQCANCGKTECIGSLADLKNRNRSKNNFFIMRHGEADKNLTDLVSSGADDSNHLTDKGREQAKVAAENIKKNKIDLIISSDLFRASETAEIILRELNLPSEALIFDSRLREIQAGELDGKSWSEYHNFFASRAARFAMAPAGGETLLDLQRRIGEALFDIEERFSGKNILLISHGSPLFFLDSVSRGLSQEDIVKRFTELGSEMELGAFQPLDFALFPHDSNFALDFHRPYIDEITLPCACGGRAKRISEVIDCWFESGAMPFAQHHYPFENRKKFEENFPGDFISEYIAQTRTWFYYTHTLSSLIFDKAAFKNVLATGTVLAEDGQKMSKSKGNFPDPSFIFDKYGVDALRFYMLSSPLMKSEDLYFSEKGVDEVCKKIILRLKNVTAFFELYKNLLKPDSFADSKNILDRWIISRLNQLIERVTAAMDAYEIDQALRPVDDFLEDLSVWYVRRSRERLKSDDETDRTAAAQTLAHVLLQFSKVIAPFMPFIAESTYWAVGGRLESVHLENWPEAGEIDWELLSDMVKTREIVGLGLEARARAGIKVRQPLSKITVKSRSLAEKKELVQLVADEINVKNVEFGGEGNASADDAEMPVVLDTTITEELRNEGNVRDFIRSVQSLRKEKGFKAGDTAVLFVHTDTHGRKFIEENQSLIFKAATISDARFGNTPGMEFSVEDMNFILNLEK